MWSRYFILSLILLFGVFGFNSCKADGTMGADSCVISRQIQTLEGKQNEIGDSLSHLSKKVFALEGEYNTLRDDFVAQRRGGGIQVILGVFSLLGLILAIVALIKSCRSGLSSHSSESEGELCDLRDRVSKLEGLENSYRNSAKGERSEEHAKLDNLEARVVALEGVKDSMNKQDKIGKEEPSAADGYFGTPSKDSGQPYFKDFSETKSEKSRFKARIIGDEARFEPLSIKVTRSEVMDDVIEFTGSDRDEANDMEVIEEGVAVYRDDQWVVEKRVKINLK